MANLPGQHPERAERLSPVLRSVSPTDRELILEWRNDPEAVSNSLTGRPVKPKEHAEWFAKRLQQQPLRMWIAEVDSRPVGFVRIDAEGRSGTVAVTIAPADRGRGLGTSVLTAVRDLVSKAGDLDVLRAQILCRNEASLRAFTKVGFKAATRKDDVTELVWRSSRSGRDDDH